MGSFYQSYPVQEFFAAITILIETVFRIDRTLMNIC